MLGNSQTSFRLIKGSSPGRHRAASLEEEASRQEEGHGEVGLGLKSLLPLQSGHRSQGTSQ